MNFRDSQPSDSVLRLERVLHRLNRALVFRHQPPPALAELPLSQLRCAVMIREQEGQKMLDLAHVLGVTLPALSQIVDKLVRRGMVERRADPDDRRIVRLYLTASALEVMREGDSARRERIENAVTLLSSKDTDSVINSMERLAEAAERSLRRIAPLEADSALDTASVAETAGVRASTAAGLSPIPAEAGQ
jgi:DNA-binding MarR family transcriptional regulator